MRLLCGHKREVLELAAVPAAPRLLLSLSRDGNLRLWDVPSETCLSSKQTDATCIVSGGWLRHVWEAAQHCLALKGEGQGLVPELAGLLLAAWRSASWMVGPACVQALAPDAASLVTGNSKGRLHAYAISATGSAAEAAAAPAAAGTAAAEAAAAAGAPVQQVSIDEGSRRELKCQGSSHSDALDCLVSLHA